ncbi:MAG: type II toxin-antitoxin system RelE/ParE family toxin [Lamprobacter sp.]|uniref:type II toxin-antitoxin system RelE/ParE family toxin n=1 Tax=Lamprobacter sp. TaxID=3100796 RepID=UPI002B2593D6|nr:type II toxin-antitoxin system RelE/ParE family toxin [Lamprobacter sp.]MEA3643805.1 type II toxin-antitoxin system RelE/ParE family toxin [Lamprobacter sp.]
MKIRHKGLRALYEKGQTKGVQQQQVKRLKLILVRLDAAREPADMDLPGLRLHPLQGDKDGFHAVKVSGNWRVVFHFDATGEATDVDLTDYH